MEADLIELNGYGWKEAREAIKDASYMKEEIEVPAIKACFDWGGLNCLELSRNDDARLALSLISSVRHVSILVPYPPMVEEVRKNVEAAGIRFGIEGRIDADYFNPNAGIPANIRQRAYDVVFAEWVSHSWLENEKLLDEILKMAGKYFLVIMPHPESDDTIIASIKNSGEKERRIRVKDNLRNFLEKNGWKVNYLEKKLPLRFRDENDARKTFYCMAFENKATEEQKTRLDFFLSGDKVRDIDDSFYIICGEKS